MLDRQRDEKTESRQTDKKTESRQTDKKTDVKTDLQWGKLIGQMKGRGRGRGRCVGRKWIGPSEAHLTISASCGHGKPSKNYENVLSVLISFFVGILKILEVFLFNKFSRKLLRKLKVSIFANILNTIIVSQPESFSY